MLVVYASSSFAATMKASGDTDRFIDNMALASATAGEGPPPTPLLTVPFSQF